MEPNIKWKFYKNDDQGLFFVTGALLHQPLNGRNEVAGVQLNETWGLFYGNFTKKVKTGDYGPRFPLVLMSSPIRERLISVVPLIAEERSLDIAAFLSKKVSFVADWYSGKNYYGYFTPGSFDHLAGEWPVQRRLQHRKRQAGPTRMPRRTVTSSCITA